MSKSLEVHLVNPNEDIDIYNWKEVKVSNYFIPNTTEVHPEGLFSNDIFGLPSTDDRKRKYGWIELNDVFMNPHCFYVLSRLKAGIANDMKCGLGRYIVDKTGELQKLEDNETIPADALYKHSGTGFEWLKGAWSHISWKITRDMSKAAKSRRKLLKAFDVDDIFWSKLLIMPAFYRDIDYKSNKRNIINTFYTKAIHLSHIIKNTDSLIFLDDPSVPTKSISHIKMQDLLTELYTFFIEKVSGANGFTNNYVVGKTTDYGARLVITPPNINTEHYTDMEASFFRSSTPLSVVANIFSPFIIFGIHSWLKNFVAGNNYINVYDFKKKEIRRVELDPTWIDEFSTQKIKKMLDLYKKSKTFRIRYMTLKGAKGEKIPISIYMIRKENGTKEMKVIDQINTLNGENTEIHWRYLTYCEFLYLICMTTSVKDKVIYNTRYPLTTYNNTYCSQMNIVPANETEQIYYNGLLYKSFPKLKRFKNYYEIEHFFTDSMRMFSVYPSALGADFDGDQISTQGVFTKEANEDALKHMLEISNVLGINTNSIRSFPAVIKHGLYNLTYKIKKE